MKRKALEVPAVAEVAAIETAVTEEHFVVKSGLKGFCKNSKLLEKIEQDVLELSDWMVEASIYIHYVYMGQLEVNPHQTIITKPKFIDYFYHLKADSKAKYEILSEYNELRCSARLQKYDGSYRSNLFISAANSYETCAMNNITVHMYSRVRKFFKSCAKETPSYETLDWLFTKKSKKLPDPMLIQHLKDKLQFTGNFHDLKQKWFTYIPFLYRLQRHFETIEHKNFRLLPIFSHGRKHIRYDSFAFYQLLASMKLTTKDFSSWPKFQPHREAIWEVFFDYRKFETARHKFGFSFTTDGVTASLYMSRPTAVTSAVMEVMPSSFKTKKKRKLSSQQDNNNDRSSINNDSVNISDYNKIIGIDPGLRLMYGMVVLDPTTQQKQRIKYKSSKFRHDTGALAQKRKRSKWSRSLAKIHENMKTISVMSKDYRQFAQFHLQHLRKFQKIYKQKKFGRLKFDKHIRVEREIYRLVGKIINNTVTPSSSTLSAATPAASSSTNKTLIFMGDPNISGWMRGYVRTPIRKITEYLRRARGVTMLNIDEFRTTKLCSNCPEHVPVVTSKSPHRFQVCPNCKTVWNRDINAANNILQNGLIMHANQRHKELHKNFQRNFQLITKIL